MSVHTDRSPDPYSPNGKSDTKDGSSDSFPDPDFFLEEDADLHQVGGVDQAPEATFTLINTDHESKLTRSKFRTNTDLVESIIHALPLAPYIEPHQLRKFLFKPTKSRFSLAQNYEIIDPASKNAKATG